MFADESERCASCLARAVWPSGLSTSLQRAGADALLLLPPPHPALLPHGYLRYRRPTASSSSRLPRLRRRRTFRMTQPTHTCVQSRGEARLARASLHTTNASMCCCAARQKTSRCIPRVQALVRWGGALLELAHFKQGPEADQCIQDVRAAAHESHSARQQHCNTALPCLALPPNPPPCTSIHLVNSSCVAATSAAACRWP